jgi:FtsP/CotA-like multicopper oxidase with cupredoxin domain
MTSLAHNIFTGCFVISASFLAGCNNIDQPPAGTMTATASASKVQVAETVDCSGTGLYQELQNPPTLTTNAIGINTQLSAIQATKCVNGRTFSLQSYIDANAGSDSRAVGPAYILNVGPALPNPKLYIQFTNRLDDPNRQYDCGHHSKDVSKCTNLHTHGLHVSPKGSPDPTQIQSDYVFIEISPATPTVRYQFDIPNDQAPGTHWIHAHLHGSTAPQVKNGMASALILKGELDNTLANRYGIGGDKEKIMILQQMAIDANNTPLCGKAPNGDAITTSINGQCLPTITVKAGDIQRWRFIHSGISASVNLAVVQADGSKQNLHEFARDGITMNGTQVQQNIMLQPGYRSDLLIQFPECKGQYPCELALVDDTSKAAVSLMGVDEPRNQIAKVIIHKNYDSPMAMPPSSIFTNPYKFVCEPSDFKACSERLAKEKLWFANVPKNPADPTGPTYKTVNDGIYPDTPVKKLRLNDHNTWKLWVGEKQNSTGNHPFHIHVNPFQIVDKNGFSYWKDTLLVSGSENKGESNALTVVTRYEDFDGEFVLHCHNLDHEDQGMMMKVIVYP